MSAAPTSVVPARARRRVYTRAAVWAGLPIALLIVVVGLAPWTISRGALREEIAAQLRSSAGVYVFAKGATHVSVLPRPRVQLDEVAMVDATGALVVETASLTGTIRLFPLLAGRLEVTEIALASPRVTIDVDRAPLTKAGAATRAADATGGSAQAQKTDAARLGVVSMSDGTISLRRNNAEIANATRVNARLDWRSIAAPAALAADLDWRGRRQQFVAWIAEPAKLLRGGASASTFELRSPETTISSAGSVTVAETPRFEGQIQVATKSTPDLLSSLGIATVTPATLDALTLDGDLVATPVSATLTGLRLSAGDEWFEGSLALQAVPDGRPLLSGTLATKSLSLKPYLAAVNVTSDPADASAARKSPDLDLRLSAARLRYDRLQASDAALSILSRNDRVEVAIVDAAAYGGAIKARAVVAPTEGQRQSDLKATVLMRGVDWGAIDRDLSGQGRLTGTADISAQLSASGESMQQMFGALAGQGRITLTNGELGGLDVPGTLSRLEKRPLAAAIDLGNGRTRFTRATLPFEIVGGVANLSGSEVVATDFAMSLAGAVHLPEGQTALTATVRPVDASGETQKSSFAFDVGGVWNRPVLTPDVRGLIRRSDAASPLFSSPTATPVTVKAP